LEYIAGLARSLLNVAAFREALNLSLFMFIGGVLGMYVRALYRRFGLTISNRDAFSANFPLLTIATVLVIFVVKSSLALSLGLVGALSIVRFRAAIKEPEGIVFLFFSIALGLALGAEYQELAFGGTLIFTLFVVLRHYSARKANAPALLLTISGPQQEVFEGDVDKITRHVREVVGPFVIQRLEVEDGHVQFRAVVAPESQEAIGGMIAVLGHRLPQCRMSYVNLSNLV
jgi:hypothetical protein